MPRADSTVYAAGCPRPSTAWYVYRASRSCLPLPCQATHRRRTSRNLGHWRISQTAISFPSAPARLPTATDHCRRSDPGVCHAAHWSSRRMPAVCVTASRQGLPVAREPIQVYVHVRAEPIHGDEAQIAPEVPCVLSSVTAKVSIYVHSDAKTKRFFLMPDGTPSPGTPEGRGNNLPPGRTPPRPRLKRSRAERLTRRESGRP